MAASQKEGLRVDKTFVLDFRTTFSATVSILVAFVVKSLFFVVDIFMIAYFVQGKILLLCSYQINGLLDLIDLKPMCSK